MEERILAVWRERDTFAQSTHMRADGEPWVFYEGPPTANGRPGSHHVLSRVFKDIFPRFQTMRGRFVDRRGGWDCHGLPVELEVEKQLGISSKPEIEAYGVAEFNARCRESVLTYLDEWEQLTERIGFWIDTDRAYRTMDTPYIESVWWSLAELWSRGRIYESHKVVPYCTRCGTALSSHEVAQGYAEVTDPSIYVRFPLTDGSGRVLVVWTTTPWTLPANQAVAVDPDVGYVEIERGDETLILAEALVGDALGEDAAPRARLSGRDLLGAEYEPPFPWIPGAHRVLAGDFVTTEDGTGIVHLAPAFGQDDFEVGIREGLDAPNPVDLSGRFTDAVPPVAGTLFKDADPALIADLDARGRLLRADEYRHSYPHCWRDGTPLIYYAMPSWYVRTTDVRDRMLDENAGIGWRPQHVRDGRFGKWLEGNVDWAISRNRYWGTPLPFWRCACGEAVAVGSLAELRERAVEPLADDFDPHRPYVDDVELGCSACGGRMSRVPEVLDVWYDSGAMPFAQQGYPHATGDLDGVFPADYICEALDQTRGWFYSLLAESTLLFDRTSFRNVVCLGLILDGDGQKMSKSRGNVIEPWTVIERQSADAFRWYLLTAQSAGESFRFNLEAVDEAMRRFLLTLWNTYAFLVTYAALDDGWQPGGPGGATAGRSDLDRWILSRLDATTAAVTEALEEFDATTAGRTIEGFVDDLSNWYVRASRRRFWGTDRRRDADPADRGAAFATLHECLATAAALVAPFCPFVSEEIWGNLVAAHDRRAPESVHLSDWPRPAGHRDEELEAAMALAQQTVALGRAARSENGLRTRQPLAEVVIAAAAADARAMEPLAGLIRDELNVRGVRFVVDPGELVDAGIKPNFRTLGPRFGSRMPAVADAVAALDPTATARALDDGRMVTVDLDGEDHALTPDDLLREVRPAEGYAVAEGSGIAVGLVTELDDDLRREGTSREIVHAIQNARKAAGLAVEDRIRLHLDGSGVIREAIDAHREAIAEETLAIQISAGHGAPFAGDHREESVLNGEPLAIRLARI